MSQRTTSSRASELPAEEPYASPDENTKHLFEPALESRTKGRKTAEWAEQAAVWLTKALKKYCLL
jgi:hypothetical protein